MRKNSLLNVRQLLIVTGALVLFLAWGVYRILEQRKMLETHVPVSAKVLSGKVDRWSSGSGSNRKWKYKPVIRYRYLVAGKSYESLRVMPLDESGSSSWAKELVAAYPVAAEITAYVDPENPGMAFLVNEYSILSYLAVLASCLGLYASLLTLGYLPHSAFKASRRPPLIAWFVAIFCGFAILAQYKLADENLPMLHLAGLGGGYLLLSGVVAVLLHKKLVNWQDPPKTVEPAAVD